MKCSALNVNFSGVRLGPLGSRSPPYERIRFGQAYPLENAVCIPVFDVLFINFVVGFQLNAAISSCCIVTLFAKVKLAITQTVIRDIMSTSLLISRQAIRLSITSSLRFRSFVALFTTFQRSRNIHSRFDNCVLKKRRNFYFRSQLCCQRRHHRDLFPATIGLVKF